MGGVMKSHDWGGGGVWCHVMVSRDWGSRDWGHLGSNPRKVRKGEVGGEWGGQGWGTWCHVIGSRDGVT